MEKLTNASGLPLACDEFLSVGQGYQPPLAAKGAHLSNVIDIYQGIPVDSPKAATLQALLKRLQCLRSLIVAICSDNPDEVSVCLKGVDLIGAQ